MNPLKLQAIQTALTGDWTTAISLNQAILDEDPTDIDTLNRLAFAHASVGNMKEAKTTYEKVLELDTQNPIALRNIKRLDKSTTRTTPVMLNPQMNSLFIEEPGKTKIVELINVAEQKHISPLRCGEMIFLSVKRMKVFILDADKQYIGMLADNIGKRLIKFMEGGNKYDAYIKTVSNHKVSIMVRETHKAARFKNQPSFILTEKPRLQIDNKAKMDSKRDLDDDKDYDSEEETDSESSF